MATTYQYNLASNFKMYKIYKKILSQTVFIIMMLMCLSCTSNAVKDMSLYEDLGGKEGIAILVEKLLWNISDDKRIVHRFIDADINRFQEKMAEMLCELSGGPCEYKGDDMHRTHAGHDISEMHFNAVVENLLDAMEDLNMSVSTQNRLIARLAPMHSDIVKK